MSAYQKTEAIENIHDIHDFQKNSVAIVGVIIIIGWNWRHGLSIIINGENLVTDTRRLQKIQISFFDSNSS